MAGVTYKCPSCGAYLIFNPDNQEWRCDFCKEAFQEKDLLAKGEAFAMEAEQKAAEQSDQDKPETAQNAEEEQASQQVAYHCPSCGSEIMTDATTVATHCYYCHNPVVLQGKLTQDMKPDMVLPFTVGKETATESFLKWAKSKKFIPKGFFAKQNIQTMSGVYYPHFISKCEMDAAFDGTGQNSTVTNTPRYIITTTNHYSFHRKAKLRFRNVMRPALSGIDRKLSDGIHPFPSEEAKPFSSAYLSGFLAERRNLKAQDIQGDISRELEGYVKPLLSDTLQYDSHSGRSSTGNIQVDTQYVLLPTWVLTYAHKSPGKDKQPYYYVMNGCTGTVCGKLPINMGKLWGIGLLIGGIVAALMCAAGYFLF